MTSSPEPKSGHGRLCSVAALKFRRLERPSLRTRRTSGFARVGTPHNMRGTQGESTGKQKSSFGTDRLNFRISDCCFQNIARRDHNATRLKNHGRTDRTVFLASRNALGFSRARSTRMKHGNYIGLSSEDAHSGIRVQVRSSRMNSANSVLRIYAWLPAVNVDLP